MYISIVALPLLKYFFFISLDLINVTRHINPKSLNILYMCLLTETSV